MNGNLGACESGVPYYCDEAADCDRDAGLVCCESSVRVLFTCQASCSTGKPQICKTDAECQGGTTCAGVLNLYGLVVGTCQ